MFIGQNGILKQGDRILEINKMSFLNLTQEKALIKFVEIKKRLVWLKITKLLTMFCISGDSIAILL